MIVQFSRSRAKCFAFCLATTPIIAGTGCAVVPKMAVTPQRYRLDVQLDVTSHEITARATIDLIRTDDDPLLSDKPVAVELLLHPDLRITGIRSAGAKLQSSSVAQLSTVCTAPGYCTPRMLPPP